MPSRQVSHRVRGRDHLAGPLRRGWPARRLRRQRRSSAHSGGSGPPCSAVSRSTTTRPLGPVSDTRVVQRPGPVRGDGAGRGACQVLPLPGRAAVPGLSGTRTQPRRAWLIAAAAGLIHRRLTRLAPGLPAAATGCLRRGRRDDVGADPVNFPLPVQDRHRGAQVAQLEAELGAEAGVGGVQLAGEDHRDAPQGPADAGA